MKTDLQRSVKGMKQRTVSTKRADKEGDTTVKFGDFV